MKYKNDMGDQEKHALNANFDPKEVKYPAFYQTLRLHKTSWTTCPIISFSGSLLYSIGVWVDLHLQKFATIQPAYIELSHQLINKFSTIIPLPPDYPLLKDNAVSMCTNIATDKVPHKIIV